MYQYRCNNRKVCGARNSLKHKLEWYIYEPKCRVCGVRDLRPVKDRTPEENKARGCFCRGNGWPHNKGRIESEYQTCIHAAIEDVALFEEASELEAQRIDFMKPDEDCPF